jgi:hypothetical protein
MKFTVAVYVYHPYGPPLEPSGPSVDAIIGVLKRILLDGFLAIDRASVVLED